MAGDRAESNLCKSKKIWNFKKLNENLKKVDQEDQDISGEGATQLTRYFFNMDSSLVSEIFLRDESVIENLRG